MKNGAIVANVANVANKIFYTRGLITDEKYDLEKRREKPLKEKRYLYYI